MPKISLCMIVRNEEKVLDRCLHSIQDVVDEIIIVDTGSVDRTKQIAQNYTQNIYDFLWVDDFSEARNFAFSKGKGDYLLWLDADDVLPKSEKEKFLELKNALQKNQPDMIMMRYDAAFDESGQPVFSYYRERLIRNCPQAKWQGAVHEVIVPFGEIVRKEIHIEHRKETQEYSDRNLRIYEKLLQKGKKLEPREQFYYARELYYHRQFQKAAEVFREFLENPLAWLENKLEAVRFLSYSLREMKKEEEAVSVLLEGLRLASPTGEICCDIGGYFFEKQQWESAVFWYESALRAEKRIEQGAFVQEDCYGYLPCIQLCVCYDRLGKWEKAKVYNEMAGVLKQGSEAVEKNKIYFAQKQKEQSIATETD